jgi:hypothetical protein
MIETKHPVPAARSSLLAKAVLLGILGAAPMVLSAQPSDTNHGSPTGVANANPNGTGNSNVNGIGYAPVPEASTWAAMGAALVVAGIVVHRRRRLLNLA